MDISFSVPSFSFITETLADSLEFTKINLPLSIFTNPEEITAGSVIRVHISLADQDVVITLFGIVGWKRLRDIKMPGKIIPAGIGIFLDDECTALLKSIEQKTALLSDIEEPMIAGNYIKIRKDIAQKYRKTREFNINSFAEKREQPRLSITIAVEVFANNKVNKFITKNISLDGMFIETEENIDIGEELAIVFEDADKQYFIKALAVRKEFSQDKSKQNGVGVKFIFENPAQKRELMHFIIRKS